MDRSPKEIVYSPNKYRETEGIKKDIDIDLSPSKRKRIFEAIRAERGELNVVQVCTFGTEGSRSACAAACRGYRSEEYPNGLTVETAQYLSSLIPAERGFLWTISDMIYGNDENDRKPNKEFIKEINKYPGLLDIITSIEGLINKHSQHASGVILYNKNPYETNAVMRSPSGDLTTQYDLHDSEFLGDVKYDFLVTSITDKLTICVELLQKDGIVPSLPLRDFYNQYLHPEKLDLNDDKIWSALAEGSVTDVFQFSDGVGLDTAKRIKPKTPIEMTSANALMRLMGEKGKERPLDRYCRLKENIELWYQEMRKRGLTEGEIKILEPHYLEDYGVPASQEALMEVCMDEKIAHFSLKEANSARKIVAKKHVAEVPKLKEKFISQCPNKNFGTYVWETVMEPQMSYAFAKPHALAYSFVGIQTLYLATNYPKIYWNCACLIVNAGGADLLNTADNDDNDENEKKKNQTTDYGKISSAIGKFKAQGISVFPPDINKSSLIFSPDKEKDAIIYGLKGITRIGSELVYEIIRQRPYISIEDFLRKVKVNKMQMINLIKSGAFDNLYTYSREEIMRTYIELVSDKKKRITLQNMQMLMTKNMIPEHLSFEKRLFNFNKYLKRAKEGIYYNLDTVAMKFYLNYFDGTNLIDLNIGEQQSAKIKQTVWDNLYKKGMNPVRDWMKKEQGQILNNLNNLLLQETIEKYAEGSVSKWEMDSLSFYYHEHELSRLKNDVYEISSYNNLPIEPTIDRTFKTKDGNEIKIFKIARIAGTVIDKDKNKSSITLLTNDGVVIVKIWKNQYAKWDKQISEIGEDGKKHIIEKSFFARGNKLIITGIRRGDSFIPKKYKNTEWPLFEKIEKLDDKGFIIESYTERADEEAE